MKIVLSIPGEQYTIPMGRFSIKALRQLGHEVIVYNHDHSGLFESAFNKINKAGLIQYKNNQLMELIQKEQPDIFFSIYGRPHPANFVEQIRSRGILTVCWWLNDPFLLPFEVMDAAPSYDYFFSNSLGTQPIYREKGVKNIHFLPVGVDLDVHKNLQITNKKYDIVFVGDHHKVREDAIAFLINKGFNVAVVGPWKRKILANSVITPHLVYNKFFTPEQMVEEYNNARIVFNIHTWINRFSYGLNPRVFEASACGAFQVSDMKDELPLFFTDKKNIVIYPSLDKLPEMLAWYLQHDEERAAIAAEAFAIAQQHTYTDRMKELLAVSGKG